MPIAVGRGSPSLARRVSVSRASVSVRSLLSMMATRQFSLANCLAMARPMPLAPPMMTAIWFSRWRCMVEEGRGMRGEGRGDEGGRWTKRTLLEDVGDGGGDEG